MRPAALPDFRKLWGRIEDDLDSGNYYINVQSNYDISEYDGEKWIVLSTTNIFGGKNNFSGLVYTTIGGMCLLLAIFFTILMCLRKKKIHPD